MAIFVGGTELPNTPGSLKLGGTDVQEVYVGGTKVWPTATILYSEAAPYTNGNNDGWGTSGSATLTTTVPIRTLAGPNFEFASLTLGNTINIGETVKFTVSTTNDGIAQHRLIILNGAAARAVSGNLNPGTTNELSYTVAGSAITNLIIRIETKNMTSETVTWDSVFVTVS